MPRPLWNAPTRPITLTADQTTGSRYAQVTLKLEGDSPAVQKINRQLAALAVNDDDQADYFRERREYLGRNGSALTREFDVEPTYWSSRFISVKFYR